MFCFVMKAFLHCVGVTARADKPFHARATWDIHPRGVYPAAFNIKLSLLTLAKRRGIYNFEGVCLFVCLYVCVSVCLSDDNF